MERNRNARKREQMLERIMNKLKYQTKRQLIKEKKNMNSVFGLQIDDQ